MASLKFQGGKELAEALNQLSKRLSRRIVLETLRDAAEPMQKSMDQKAPAATGRLKKNMVITNSRGADAKEAAVVVGPARGTFYGSFHEFGTSKIPAQPFMRPAFDENVDKSLRMIGDGLWRELAGRGVSRPMQSMDVDFSEDVRVPIPKAARVFPKSRKKKA